ncbi:hypothetical protein J7I93_15870 [Bacillus sp. ISL-47]|uniref:hypothetical protein n=1 Tax=Bacillus sp. ISL-47 TaxID=2819130 RepID=UPI001BEA9E78|nr:hypothetical protein [Bacillus sp. ISL-47]MBT2689666.1 hypothetical protein [Bacillus sp. ISL-47]MBT2709312.1 hypothetical protein [Pseudomonas sp. ISL-84]
MGKGLLYWRIFFIIGLVALTGAKVIDRSTFYAIIVGGVLAEGTKWLIGKMKER